MTDDRDTPAADADPTKPISEAEAAVGRATVGRYQIRRVLGRGGMGVVVEAHDPELDRLVAVKILVGSAQPEALGAALRREAQALARVTHPNVLSVYDAGVDGSPYLVMQLVDGETLGARIARTHPPASAVLGLFLQAARGLAAIHAKGLIHRDVKPSNILVDKQGSVHVADLGLARISELAQAGVPGTGGSGHTSTIAGTPAYMAPEQLAGRELTSACDQYSFCVALWEAWFGERPTVPPPSDVRADGVSTRQIAALRRGLSQDPADRYPSIEALASALDAVPVVAATPVRQPWWLLGALGGAGVVAVGGALALGAWSTQPSHTTVAVASTGSAAPAGVAPFDLADARRLTMTDACDEFPAFAPDGTIYYDAVVGADQHLYAIDPNSREPRELTQTTGWDMAPVPSPDGTRIVFLRKTDNVMAAYIAPIGDIASAKPIINGGFRPSWSPDGRYVWAGGRKGLARFAADTLVLDKSVTLPTGAFPMMAIELDDGRLVVLTRTGSASADGLYLYERDTTTPPFALIPTSDEHPMEEVLARSPGGDGVLVAKLAVSNNVELWHVPLDGSPHTQVGTTAIQARKKFDARGKQIIWSDCMEYFSLANLTTTATGATKFVDIARNKWVDFFPTAVPNTDDIVFLSYRSTTDEIWRMSKTGENPRVIPFGKHELDRIAISHDGTWIVGSNDNGVFAGPIDGSAEPRKLADNDDSEQFGVFSRDGATIYVEQKDGTHDRIAAIPRAGGAPTWITPAGTVAPAVSPTDDTLAYLTEVTVPGKALQRVISLLDLKTKQTRRLGIPAYPYRDLRWSPDGKRLLAARRDGNIVEVEVATSKILRTFDVGADQLLGATYSGDDILVGHATSAGDIWLGELR